jgi:integrator complex subunit 7
MSTSFDELDSLQSSTRINCSCNLEKDLYSLYHFAMASLLGVCGSAEAETIQNVEDCLSALKGGLQVLSNILVEVFGTAFHGSQVLLQNKVSSLFHYVG